MSLKRFVIEPTCRRSALPRRATWPAQRALRTLALAQLVPRVQWEHSYVTGDKTFCIYLAEDEASIHEHARISGFQQPS